MEASLELAWLHEDKMLCQKKDQIKAFDLATGKCAWTRTLEQKPVMPLIVQGETAYVVDSLWRKAILKAINLKSGEVIWSYTYPEFADGEVMSPTGSGFVLPTEKHLVLLN